MKKIICLFSLLAWVQTSAFAIIRYVKPTASGNGDGSSWANASADIQAMIDASTAGDEVWVAGGVYVPLYNSSGNASPADIRTKTFKLNKSITLYGGFAGTETSLNQRDFVNNLSILSGDIDNNDSNSDGNNIAEIYSDALGENAYNVVLFENGMLDGFVITGGMATGTSNDTFSGGAMRVNSSSGGALSNLIIAGNQANSDGGAFDISSGGATISNSIFYGNKASSGGAMSVRSSAVSIINSLFFDNLATTYGGAIEANGTTPVSISNSTFTFNESQFRGGAFYFSQSSTLTSKNSIVYGNTASSSGNDFYFSQSATGNASYSIIQNSGGSGSWNGSFGTDNGNNFDRDPLFTNDNTPEGIDGIFRTADDGFQLTSCSIGVNTGDNTGAPTIDLAQAIRPFSGGNIDMGSYEFQGTSTALPDPTGLSVSPTTINCGETISLAGTCSSGTLTWYGSNNSTSNTGTGTGLSVSPNNSRSYFAACEDGSGCSSINRIAVNVSVIGVASPTNITANITEGCYGQNVTYSASCVSGTITWYRLNVSSPQGSGASFTKPLVGITYQVSCKESASCESPKVNVPGVTISVPQPTGISASRTNICTGNSILLYGNCQTGTIAWYDAFSNGNFLGSGTGLEVYPTTSTYRYYAECQTAECNTSRTSALRITVSSTVTPDAPTAVTVNQTQVCVNSNVVLNASCTAGTLVWYTQPTGGTSIGTGQLLSPVVTQNVTYYASCEDTNCKSDRVATEAVVALPSSGLPNTLTLTNNITGSSTQQAVDYINANNNVVSPASVLYEAGKAINLQEGFETESGVVFTAKADLEVCP